METDFVTPPAQVDMAVESVPLTLCCPSSHGPSRSRETHAASIALVRCDVMTDLGVVNATGIDRTGLFVWRGARDFVHLYEAFCQHAAAAGAALACPFDVAVELGAGSGLGTLTVAACTAATFPAAADTCLCVATDYWAPSLSLLERSAQSTRASWPALCPQPLPMRTHTLDWLHWSAAVVAHTASLADASHLDALDAVMGFRRHADTTRSIPRVWFYGLDVIYPDTRSTVLLALLSCVRQLLAAYHDSTHDFSDARFTGLFTDTFVSSFVERDAGATLRRILASCVVMEMDVVPLASPFTHASATTAADTVRERQPPLAEALPFLLDELKCHSGDTYSWQTCCETAWASLRRGLHALITATTTTATAAAVLSPLALAVAGGGSWLFAFRPRQEHHDHHRGDDDDADASRRLKLEALLASPDALRDALRGDPMWEPWATLLPWLFFSDPASASALPLHELAMCAEWDGTRDHGAPHIKRTCASARRASADTVDAETFLLDGFDL